MICNRKKLLAAAKLAALCTERKGALPVLQTVRLTLSGSGVRCEATDLSFHLRVTADAVEDCDNEEQMDTVVPAQLLLRVLGAMEQDAVTLETEINLESESARLFVVEPDKNARLLTWDPDDFPAWPAGPDGGYPCSASLPQKEFHWLLKQAAPFVSVDQTRYILNGALLMTQDASEPVLQMVGTDGRRLVILSEEGAAPEELEKRRACGEGLSKQAVFPRKAVSILLHLMAAGGESPVHLEWDERSFRITGGNWLLVGRCIEGNYPNFMAVVPSCGHHLQNLPADRISDMVDAVCALQAGENVSVGLEIQTTGRLRVHRAVADVGEFEQMTDLPDAPAGKGSPGLTVRLNPEYLLAALPEGEQFTLAYDDGKAPLMLISHDGRRRVVLMPMRLEEPAMPAPAPAADETQTAVTVETEPCPPAPAKRGRPRKNTAA